MGSLCGGVEGPRGTEDGPSLPGLLPGACAGMSHRRLCCGLDIAASAAETVPLHQPGGDLATRGGEGAVGCGCCQMRLLFLQWCRRVGWHKPSGSGGQPCAGDGGQGLRGLASGQEQALSSRP